MVCELCHKSISCHQSCHRCRSFFLLNASADLIVHYGVPGLPEQLDYASAVVALSVEGFLFLWHQHGHSPLDTMVHTYLVYAIGLCVVAGALEMMRPSDVRPSLARAAFLMLQGGDLIQKSHAKSFASETVKLVQLLA